MRWFVDFGWGFTNTAAILIGTLIGLKLRKITDRMRTSGMQGNGVFVVTIGISMGISGLKNPLKIIASVVIGTVLGTAWHIERKIEAIASGSSIRQGQGSANYPKLLFFRV